MISTVSGVLGIIAAIVSILTDLAANRRGAAGQPAPKPKRGISLKAICRGWISLAIWFVLLMAGCFGYGAYLAASANFDPTNMGPEEQFSFVLGALTSPVGYVLGLGGMFIVCARPTYVAAMQAGRPSADHSAAGKFYRYGHGFFCIGTGWIALSYLVNVTADPAWAQFYADNAPESLQKGEMIATCAGSFFGAVMGGED